MFVSHTENPTAGELFSRYFKISFSPRAKVFSGGYFSGLSFKEMQHFLLAAAAGEAAAAVGAAAGEAEAGLEAENAEAEVEAEAEVQA